MKYGFWSRYHNYRLLVDANLLYFYFLGCFNVQLIELSKQASATGFTCRDFWDLRAGQQGGG